MGQNDPRWQEFSQRYATCTREFSEAVAQLGGHRNVGPNTVTYWQKIKALHALCLPLEKEIDRHLGLEERQMSAGARGE